MKPQKNKKLIKKDVYTTGNLLYYLYHQSDYKLIGIDLSRQENRNIPQH